MTVSEWWREALALHAMRYIIRQRTGKSAVNQRLPPANFPLAPVHRGDTLGEQACRSLRAALRRGALAPGEKLATRRIAATLGVSLTPAREALNRLVAERVLEQRDDRTIAVPELTRARYRELLLIRLELETLAARLGCAALAAPATLARLRALYDAQQAAFLARDPAATLQLNVDFHFTLYAAAAMPTLLQIIESLWLQAGPTIRLLYPASFELGWIGRQNHAAMLDAIAAGDADALVRAVRQDLHDGQARLERSLWSAPETTS
jgi:DNA-binding GntR family transcriptional regulator